MGVNQRAFLACLFVNVPPSGTVGHHRHAAFVCLFVLGGGCRAHLPTSPETKDGGGGFDGGRGGTQGAVRAFTVYREAPSHPSLPSCLAVGGWRPARAEAPPLTPLPRPSSSWSSNEGRLLK